MGEKKNKKNFRPRLNIEQKEVWNSIISRCKHLGLKESYDILHGTFGMTDEEILDFNVKLAKQKQKFQDLNRIERKALREQARIENALGEYHKALIDRLESNPISIVKQPKFKRTKENAVIVVQLSDTHFNELVDLHSNKYDFQIASKRLKLFADKIIKTAIAEGSTKIVITLGGDLLNSDRRKDEMLSMASNRANASLLGAELLTKFYLYIADETGCEITTCSVTGNEARPDKELGWSEIMASDSYDTMIYGMMYFLLKKDKRFTFIPIKSNEVVFSVNGVNFLQIHGHQVTANLQKSIQQIQGKYASQGIIIDFVLFGHIHYCQIGDHLARNSSLVGSNAYSEAALNFVSRASQNLHVVDKVGRINSMKIDLQIVDDVIGFDIDDLCDCYNARSLKKTQEENQTTIFKVVI